MGISVLPLNVKEQIREEYNKKKAKFVIFSLKEPVSKKTIQATSEDKASKNIQSHHDLNPHKNVKNSQSYPDSFHDKWQENTVGKYREQQEV